MLLVSASDVEVFYLFLNLEGIFGNLLFYYPCDITKVGTCLRGMLQRISRQHCGLLCNPTLVTLFDAETSLEMARTLLRYSNVLQDGQQTK